MCVCVHSLSPTLFDPLNCSLPGTSVREISQARILEQVAISFSRGSSQPRDQTRASGVSCTAGRLCTTEPLGKPVCVCVCVCVYIGIIIYNL